MNWPEADKDLLEFAEALSAFRSQHLSVRQTRFLHGRVRESDGSADVEWTDFCGRPLEWSDAGLSNLCLTLRVSAEAPESEPDSDAVFIAFNRSAEDLEVALPENEPGFHWVRGIDSARASQGSACETGAGTARVAGQSVAAFVTKKDAAAK